MNVEKFLRTISAILLILNICGMPGISFGHAFPDHSDPRVGATLSASPVGVYIWFDGDLEPAFSKIAVQDATGKKVDQGNGRVNPSNSTLLEIGVQPLPAGNYRVIWNVVSRDGHRTNGDYTFTVK